MRRMSALWVLGLLLLNNKSFGQMINAEDALEVVKTRVESMVKRNVAGLLPLSMHASVTTGFSLHLNQGKFSPGEFSDYFGSVEITERLMNNYYFFRCSVGVRVTEDTLRKRMPHEVVLSESGNDEQLIGRFYINCRR